MFAFLRSRAAQTADVPTPKPPLPALDAADLIDVRDLIARYSNSEHITRADAYFAGLADDDKLLRKPFFGIGDTQANMHGIAEVLQRLRLFPGARVLDFGAGTGWFSRMLAFIDCRAVAVDMSASALGLGQRAFARDPVAANLAVEWRVFDGVTLPLDDGSVDRIVCYDSFHHVADQAQTLREFHRVLAEGGRAVFHEPGPHHSRGAQSQYEMRHHDVIENDIVLDEIWALACEIGFGNLEVALATPRTPSVKLDRYNRIIAGQPTPGDADALLAAVVEGAANLRIFSMSKGEDQLDSRHKAGLAGSFDVTLTETGAHVRGRARVTNTGSTPWLPSVAAVGGVWLGVHWPNLAPGAHFGRIWLSDEPVLPGRTVNVAFSLQDLPPRPTPLIFDLVAEEVTWFEPIGTKPAAILLE